MMNAVRREKTYSLLCLDFLESAEGGIAPIAFFRTSWNEEGDF